MITLHAFYACPSIAMGALLFLMTAAPVRAASDPVKLEGYEMTFPAMGSTVSLTAYASDPRQVEVAFEAARREVDRLVGIFSDYEPTSELNRLHDAAASTPAIELSPDLERLFRASQRWHLESEGTFDAAIGNLTRLWREARRAGQVPSPAAISLAREHSGWAKVRLDPRLPVIRFEDPELRIDLGGIAAGDIVDRAYAILRSHGLDRCLINAGGDIRCGAPPPERPGWKIEIASLVRGGPPLRRIYLVHAAITTSGDLWQFTTVDGQRLSHILDPKTGYGVRGPMTVSVIAPTCLEADAAATAVCVLGAEKGLRWIEGRSGYEAIWHHQGADGRLLEEKTAAFPLPIPATGIDHRPTPQR